MAAPGERRSAGDSNPSRGATPTDTFLRGTRHLAASTLRSATVRQAGLHHSHVRNDFHLPVEWRCWTSLRSRSGDLAAGARLTHAADLHRHPDVSLLRRSDSRTARACGVSTIVRSRPFFNVAVRLGSSHLLDDVGAAGCPARATPLRRGRAKCSVVDRERNRSPRLAGSISRPDAPGRKAGDSLRIAATHRTCQYSPHLIPSPR
jgi:hypothetical protein